MSKARPTYQVQACPFCREFPEMRAWHGGPFRTLISCVSDHCAASPSVVGRRPEHAARLWNDQAIWIGLRSVVRKARGER